MSQPRETRGGRLETAETPHFADYEAIYSALTVDAGTADDLAAIRHHVALNGLWIAQEVTWLDRRCDRLARDGTDGPTYRAAVLQLAARIDELRRWHDGTALPSTPRRLSAVVNEPVPGPVMLSDGTLVENVVRGISRLLTAVDYVLSRPGLTGADVVLGVYLEHLAALGIQARIEVVQ